MITPSNTNHYFRNVVVAFATLLRISRAQVDLDCNFDDQTFCEWSNALNANEDDFDWQISDTVEVDGFHSLPRSVSGTGYFANAQGKFRETESDTARAWLRSPVLDSLTQSATLSFNYYKQAIPPILQVCTRDAGSSELRCLDTISGLGPQDWTQRVITIPPNPLPFQIIIAANNFNSPLDTVGLDDIVLTRSQSDQYGNTNNYLNSFSGNSINNYNNRNQKGPYNSNPATSYNRFGNFGSGQRYPAGLNLQRLGKATDGAVNSVHPSSLLSSSPAPPIRGTIINQRSSGLQPRVENSVGEEDPLDTALTRVSETQLLNVPGDGVDFGQVIENVLAPARPTRNFPDRVDIESSTSECIAVACTFNTDYCDWLNDKFATAVGGNVFDWKLRNFNTPYDGIPGASSHGSYVFATGDSRTPNQSAILRSGRFIIPQGASFQFSVFFSDTSVGRLRLYRNNIRSSGNILWHAMGYGDIGRGWKRVTQPIPPSDDPVSLIFVADQISGAYIGIDDLRLVDSTDREIGCTTLRSTSRRARLRSKSVRRRSQFSGADQWANIVQSFPNTRGQQRLWRDSSGFHRNEVSPYYGSLPGPIYAPERQKLTQAKLIKILLKQQLELRRQLEEKEYQQLQFQQLQQQQQQLRQQQQQQQQQQERQSQSSNQQQQKTLRGGDRKQQLQNHQTNLLASTFNSVPNYLAQFISSTPAGSVLQKPKLRRRQPSSNNNYQLPQYDKRYSKYSYLTNPRIDYGRRVSRVPKKNEAANQPLMNDAIFQQLLGAPNPFKAYEEYKRAVTLHRSRSSQRSGWNS